MRDLEQVGQIIEELVRKAENDPIYRPWGGRFDRQKHSDGEPQRRTGRRTIAGQMNAQSSGCRTQRGGQSDERQGRQSKKPFMKPGKDFQPLQGQQMSLFPCADLFPEAYS